MRKLCLLLMVAACAAGVAAAAPARKVIQAESGTLAPGRVIVVEQEGFSGGRGIVLQPDVPEQQKEPLPEADATFTFSLAAPGRYWVATHTATTGEGRRKMERSRNKYDSLRIMIALDDGWPRRRVLVSPWKNQDGCREVLNKYDFGPGEHTLRLWLPAGAVLDRLELLPYNPPVVPAAARDYQPPLLPPAGHPRLWLTADSLPQIKANLTLGENRAVWDELRAAAAKPYLFAPPADRPLGHTPALQKAAVSKAFVAMMTEDRQLAQEAAELMSRYMALVEYDNMLDITRELGETIYAGALVYDWCHAAIPAEQREPYRAALLRLAEDMEIGWPPFRHIIVNGHGNEAQVNRDLLAMSIALHGEEDLPYRYCAYRMFEELIPMRAVEYQSNRHNQGVGYASFRFAFEMHAAWLLRRMAGREVFDPSIRTVYNYFLYGRLPSGAMMLDGDGSLNTGLWRSPLLSFLCYTYNHDPVIKGDFLRNGGTVSDPVLFLLLNDPALAASDSLNGLPLAHAFQGVLPGIIARTGWDIRPDSDDLFVEMKGGAYHFNNHQHPDAGAFQIFYRGYLATDLGMYGFYGTPYDMGFNKRTIAHNTMLVHDPAETFPRSQVNDGGQRIIPRCPGNLADLLSDPVFKIGETLAADIGPYPARPLYTFLKSDLRPAYTDKVIHYTRTFCFLNQADFTRPGTLIVADHIRSARPDLRKYWVLNSLTEPRPLADGVEILSPRLQLPGKLTLQMLQPAAVTVRIDGGERLHDIFGQRVSPPIAGLAQAKGFRTMVTPGALADTDLFVAVMQITDADVAPLPVHTTRGDGFLMLGLADRLVLLTTGDAPLAQPFTLPVPPADGAKIQVLLSGLAPGPWHLQGPAMTLNFQVEAGKGTAFFLLPAAEYRVVPAHHPRGKAYAAPALPAPPARNPLAGKIRVDGQVLEAAPLMQDKVMLVPAAEVFAAMGGRLAELAGEPRRLQLSLNGQTTLFSEGSERIAPDGVFFAAHGKTEVRDGRWYVCAAAAAALGGCTAIADPTSNSAILVRNTVLPEVLWIDSNCGFSRDALAQVSQDHAGKTAYWSADGEGLWFEIVYPRPRTLDGVAIRWHQGASRTARFKLEVTADGPWETVHDGSSRKENGLELYPFAARPVRRLRFTGQGNSINAWNSIISFLPQTTAPAAPATIP